MKTNTTKLLIIMAFLTLIAVGGFFGAIQYINSLNTKTDDAKIGLVNSQVTSIKLEQLRVVALSGASELDAIEKYIVEPGKEVQIVQQIEDLASISSLTHTTQLIETNDDPALLSQNKQFLHLIIATDGTWKGTQKFLSFIENLPYNVKINNVDTSVGGISGSSSLPVWHSSFDFSLVEKKASSTQQ